MQKQHNMRKLTQEEFIRRVEIYSEDFDLSLAKFTHTKEKVDIICKNCGNIFKIRPNDLMSGVGCPNCKHLKTGKYYKDKFVKKYGNKYDYSYVIDNKRYNSNDTIKINCKKHGVYEQKIKNHLAKCGCPGCGKEKMSISNKLEISEVEERLLNVCGGKLSYNIKEYINTNTPIKLTRLKCGNTFKRDLNALKTNNSCPFCNGKQRNRSYTTEEFIKIASKIHDNKYDYSKSIYTKSDKKLCIICHEKDKFGNEHGEFFVTPHSHIGVSKTGCPKCSGKYKKTTNDFIIESNQLHDFHYDYSKVKYINAKTKVCIICPEHGEFWQSPNDHLSGCGCPVCKESKCEKQIKKLLKNNDINFIPQYKPTWLCNMSLDFFIPDKNIAIEVQGLQHFKAIKYWGGQESYLKVIERDYKKKALCEKNNVKLVYYSELKIDLPNNIVKNISDLLKILTEHDKK